MTFITEFRNKFCFMDVIIIVMAQFLKRGIRKDKNMENLWAQRYFNGNFTKSQAKIAEYIEKNGKRAVGMTSREIAKEIGLSDATVIRFSRTLGFAGYPQLQDQIKKDLNKQDEKIGKYDLKDRYAIQIRKHKEGYDRREEVLRLMNINLETSIRQNSEESYERVVSALLKARKKMVIGLRGSVGVARQFSRLLEMIVENTYVITAEDQDSMTSMMDLNDKDAVIFLNFPRYYKIDVKMCKILKQNKVLIILITDSMDSPVSKYASDILLVDMNQYGFFHSMLGTEALLEYLMILICWREPEVFYDRLKERDSMLEEYILKQNQTG